MAERSAEKRGYSKAVQKAQSSAEQLAECLVVPKAVHLEWKWVALSVAWMAARKATPRVGMRGVQSVDRSVQQWADRKAA